VPLVDFRELSSNTNVGEASEVIRQRVVAVRQIQHERFRRCGHSTNAAMTSRQARQHCQLDAESTGYLVGGFPDDHPDLSSKASHPTANPTACATAQFSNSSIHRVQGDGNNRSSV